MTKPYRVYVIRFKDCTSLVLRYLDPITGKYVRSTVYRDPQTGVETPTGMPEVPLGLAVLTFLYYNYQGIRVNGPIGYLKQFAGPLWWLAPLLFPIEVVSHLARMMSLTIRLYANMFASDLLTLVWFSIIPIAVPSVFLGLHFAVSLIQAFVFMLLTMIYLSMAVAHEH